jgi:hypothetical protein
MASCPRHFLPVTLQQCLRGVIAHNLLPRGYPPPQRLSSHNVTSYDVTALEVTTCDLASSKVSGVAPFYHSALAITKRLPQSPRGYPRLTSLPLWSPTYDFTVPEVTLYIQYDLTGPEVSKLLISLP